MKYACRQLSFVAVIVLFFVACSGDGSDGHTGVCPPGYDYDEERERCVSDGPSPDASLPSDADSGGENDSDGSPPYQPQDVDDGDSGDGESDSGIDVSSDTGDGDAEPVDPCAAVSCGANATCDDGVCECDDGYHGDPDEACVSISACGIDGCDYAEWCDDGQCRCKWGFTATADGCERDPPPQPEQRTTAEVCSAWEQVSNAPMERWKDEPVDDCDWGVLHPNYHNTAMTKVSIHRWLIGMEAVASTEAMRDATQACATFHAAEGGPLDHYPEEDTACYTPEGYNGAASSNLAGGSSATGAVDLWLNSIGHRRWMLNPTLQNTAFGSRSGYVCLYVTSTGSTSTADFYAYPAPGNFPRAAIVGQWMVTSSSWGLNGDVDIDVTRLSDGESLSVNVGQLYSADMARPSSIVFQPAGVESGESYEVTLSNLTGAEDERSYEVNLIDC